ncbi:hypothetical protein [Symbioplanes lichenis]|uniref:hypothetical protein n=1 Tax=Symbioplanes lichenis TaxID=1629072 RepID=UPI002739F8B7|nr:hypothetical protein [Actinoplanes lichenis]
MATGITSEGTPLPAKRSQRKSRSEPRTGSGLKGKPQRGSESTVTARETSASEVWQARVTHELSAKLVEDMAVLGLDNKTEAVRTALELLHRHAAEIRMAEGVRIYYGGQTPPLPTGVIPFDPSEIEDDDE